MIEGEAGTYTLDKVMELREHIDGDTITCTLNAAVYADALRKGVTPRSLIDDIWKAMPDDAAWDGQIREQMEAAIELREEQEAA